MTTATHHRRQPLFAPPAPIGADACICGHSNADQHVERSEYDWDNTRPCIAEGCDCQAFRVADETED